MNIQSLPSYIQPSVQGNESHKFLLHCSETLDDESDQSISDSNSKIKNNTSIKTNLYAIRNLHNADNICIKTDKRRRAEKKTYSLNLAASEDIQEQVNTMGTSAVGSMKKNNSSVESVLPAVNSVSSSTLEHHFCELLQSSEFESSVFFNDVTDEHSFIPEWVSDELKELFLSTPVQLGEENELAFPIEPPSPPASQVIETPSETTPSTIKRRKKARFTSEMDQDIIDMVNKHAAQQIEASELQAYGKRKYPIWTKLSEIFMKQYNTYFSTDSIRNHYRYFLNPNVDRSPLSKAECALIYDFINKNGHKWSELQKLLPTRSTLAIQTAYYAKYPRLKKRS